MLLRHLFESKNVSVGIIFGRFNPPHQGHRAAWEMAAQNEQWFVGTNQSTQGPKDPLPYNVKIKAMEAVWPEIKGHIVPETSWLTLASKVYNEYGSISLNVYTDEDWVTKTLIQYNGKEGAHGLYNFKNIKQRPTPRLSSATALRAAVQAGDRDAFAKAAGVDANTSVGGKPFFDVVAYFLAPYADAPKKVVKKKAPAPVKDVAEGSETRCPQCGSTNCSCEPSKCKCKPIAGWIPNKGFKKAVDEAANAAQQAAIAIAKKKKKGVEEDFDDDANKVNPGKPIPYPKGTVKVDVDDVYDWYKLGMNISDLDDANPKDFGRGPPQTVLSFGSEPLEHKYLKQLKRLGMPTHDIDEFKKNLAELSSDMLGRYKKAASDDASKADKAGNFEKGNKRFKGIVKATNKQFDNDTKGKK